MTIKTKKSKLETLSYEQIEAITHSAEKRRNVPLVKSQQVNARIDATYLEKIKVMARAQRLPYTTFITKLIREDVDRLWSVFHKTAHKEKAA